MMLKDIQMLEHAARTAMAGNDDPACQTPDFKTRSFRPGLHYTCQRRLSAAGLSCAFSGIFVPSPLRETYCSRKITPAIEGTDADKRRSFLERVANRTENVLA